MADRDDSNLKHFQSRSQQPAFSKNNASNASPGNINIYLQFDSGFGKDVAEIDDTSFNYTGTSPTWSSYNSSGVKKNNMTSVASTFQS